jgi:hypothetical protein
MMILPVRPVSWTERDRPPARRGFGTVVIEAMAKHSVRGTVDLDAQPLA